MSQMTPNPDSAPSYKDPSRIIIFRVGSIVALIAALILAAAIIPVPTIFQENFLALIFKLPRRDHWDSRIVP